MARARPHPDGVLPGTTFPDATPNGTSDRPHTSAPLSAPGPVINGRPTTLTLYEPAQLAEFPYLTSLQSMLNMSFRDTFQAHKILTHIQRLSTPTQFLAEVGTDEGTFTYILTAADASADVLATISAHRYVQKVLMAQADERSTKVYQTFTRFEVPACAQDDDEWAVDVWELKVVAVARKAQRCGLAGILMRAADEEVKARFRKTTGAAGGENGAQRGRRHRCVMLLSSINELTGEFYERKGYVCGSARKFPAGHLDSESAFTFGQFSKVLEEI